VCLPGTTKLWPLPPPFDSSRPACTLTTATRTFFGAEQRTPLKIQRSTHSIAQRTGHCQSHQRGAGAAAAASSKTRSSTKVAHAGTQCLPHFLWRDGLFRSIARAVGTALLLIRKDAGGARATHTRFRKRTQPDAAVLDRPRRSRVAHPLAWGRHVGLHARAVWTRQQASAAFVLCVHASCVLP
jgi:hypothetical protein